MNHNQRVSHSDLSFYSSPEVTWPYPHQWLLLVTSISSDHTQSHGKKPRSQFSIKRCDTRQAWMGRLQDGERGQSLEPCPCWDIKAVHGARSAVQAVQRVRSRLPRWVRGTGKHPWQVCSSPPGRTPSEDGSLACTEDCESISLSACYVPSLVLGTKWTVPAMQQGERGRKWTVS